MIFKMKNILKITILALAVITILSNDVDRMALKFLNKNNNQDCLINGLKYTSLGCTCEADQCVCPIPIFEALKQFEVQECNPTCLGRCYCVKDKCICPKLEAEQQEYCYPACPKECNCHANNKCWCGRLEELLSAAGDKCDSNADCHDVRYGCVNHRCVRNWKCLTNADCDSGLVCCPSNTCHVNCHH
jgi:hypothetical protein